MQILWNHFKVTKTNYTLCISIFMQLSGTVIKSKAILTGFIVSSLYLLMHYKLKWSKILKNSLYSIFVIQFKKMSEFVIQMGKSIVTYKFD